MSNECPKWRYKWIWKIDTLSKGKVFLWQLCNKALPIRGALFKPGVQINPTCPLCFDEKESGDHFFSSKNALQLKKYGN